MSLTCRQCGGWDEKNPSSYKKDHFYCKQRYGGADYVDLNDSSQAKKCYNKNRFILNKNRLKDSDLKDFKPWGLHIITAVAEILNLEDDANIKLLLASGIEYKESDNSLKEVLFEEYDITGKIIADNIKKMNIKEELATVIYNYYFLPMANLIREGKSQESLIIFANLVKELKEYFEIRGLIDLGDAIDYLKINNDDMLLNIYNTTKTEEINIDNFINLNSFIINSQNEKLIANYIQVKESLNNLLDNCDTEELKKQIIRNYYFTYFKIMFMELENISDNTEEILTIMLGNMLISINSGSIDRIKENEENMQYKRVIKMSDR